MKATSKPGRPLGPCTRDHIAGDKGQCGRSRANLDACPYCRDIEDAIARGHCPTCAEIQHGDDLGDCYPCPRCQERVPRSPSGMPDFGVAACLNPGVYRP